MTMTKKNFTELSQIPDFEGRINYLRLHGDVGRETFGYDRYLNQVFYNSPEWKKVRRQVILRDKSCDLAHPDHEIFPKGHRVVLQIHHMNPITKEDVLERSDDILNPEYLITVSKRTHDIIHYGYGDHKSPVTTERTPNDTCPWRST